MDMIKLAETLKPFGVQIDTEVSDAKYVHMSGGITGMQRWVDLRWSSFDGFNAGTSGIGSLSVTDLVKYNAQLAEVMLAMSALFAAGFKVKTE